MCLVQFLVKYVLFIVNLVFALLGAVVIGLGIATLVYVKDLAEILPIRFLGIATIVLGSVVFLISFLACCGAVRESPCMLISYAVLVSVLASLKIWLTVVIYRGLSSIEDVVTRWLDSAFGNPAFSALELSFVCCGTTGPDSYGTSPLPPSCCNQYNGTTCAIADANTLGCNTRVEGWISSFGGAVGGILLTIIVTQCVGVIFSIFLCSAVKRKEKRDYY